MEPGGYANRDLWKPAAMQSDSGSPPETPDGHESERKSHSWPWLLFGHHCIERLERTTIGVEVRFDCFCCV